MKAIILARVSTKEQEEQGHSLPAQVHRLKEYAKKHNLTIAKEFAFSETAGAKIRKKFEEVIAYLKSHKDVQALLCMNVDRVTRNFRDAVDLDEMRKKEGLAIHFVQDGFVLDADATGNAMFMWEAKVFIAKQYINRLADDAKRSINHKAEHGEWIAKAPIGYCNAADTVTSKRTVVLDEERAFLVRKIFQDYATGCYSLRELAAQARSWGLTNSKSGRPLSVKQVHELLHNPFYYGFMRIKGALFAHNYPTLTDLGLFEKCHQVGRRGKLAPFKRTDKPFVFRGLLKCAKCGCSYSSEIKKQRYIYLRPTKSKGACECFQTTEASVLEQVAHVFEHIRIPEAVCKALIKSLKESVTVKKEHHQQAVHALQKEYGKTCTMLDNLLDMRLDGSITKSEYDKKAYTLQQRRQELERQLQDYGKADDAFVDSVEALFLLASRAPKLFESSGIEQKRKLMAFIFSNLTLNGATLGYTLRKPFDLFADAAARAVWRPLRESNPCYHRERVVS